MLWRGSHGLLKSGFAVGIDWIGVANGGWSNQAVENLKFRVGELRMNFGRTVLTQFLESEADTWLCGEAKGGFMQSCLGWKSVVQCGLGGNDWNWGLKNWVVPC